MKALHKICICLLLALTSLGAGGAEPKRVLFIHSFGWGFMPVHTGAELLRTELASQVGAPIDFFDVSLESTRFADLEQHGPLLDYLRAQVARRQFDLVVAVGGPAAQFAQQLRQPLFPETPMLMAMETRYYNRINRTAKDRAACMSTDPELTVKTMLQALPETTNVVVVMGNSAYERFWSADLRRDLQQYTNRVNFVWLDQLPFPEMLERCATLPPRSAILFVLLCVDAAGVPHQEERALLKLHEAANAPIFGLWGNQLGKGILGGRLVDSEKYARTTASAAARILRGESPGSIVIPPQSVGPPEFDWRELRRWGISEGRLPPGSVIKFREPTVWEKYRWWIAGTILFCALQTALIIGLIVNRVARKRADQELRDSEARLSLAADAAAAGLWRLNLATRNYWVTPKTRELFAFGADEVITFDRFLSRVHPEDRELVRQKVQQVLQSKGEVQVEYRILQPDGSMRWMLSRGRVHVSPAGQTDYLMGITMDTTPRKQAEEARRESEARLASAVAVAGLGFYDMGADATQVFVDERLRSLLGLTPQDNHRVQEYWIERIHPEDRERVRELSRKVLAGELQGTTIEYRYEHPQRGTLWFSHMSHVLEQDPAGRAVRRLGVVRDITEQRQAEQERLHLRDNLAHLTRVNTLGALSGSLAHELNQPLGIILSNAQAAQELLTQEPPDMAEVQAILVDIVKADRRAGEVIERLRALFKGGQSSRQKLSLNVVIEEVLRLTRAELLSRSVSTTCDLAPDLPPVTGDRVQLQQLVLNLILNAVDAMAANAPARRRLHLRTMLCQEHVCASVRDEGEGLPANVERIFQPLYTTKPQGLGMGLVICRTIVDSHGGRLWAERHPERGAIFHFELPVAREEQGSGFRIQEGRNE